MNFQQHGLFLLSLHMSTQDFDVFAKLRLMTIMAIKEFVCAYFMYESVFVFLNFVWLFAFNWSLEPPGSVHWMAFSFK